VALLLGVQVEVFQLLVGKLEKIAQFRSHRSPYCILTARLRCSASRRVLNRQASRNPP
jgi:hypothetical protein